MASWVLPITTNSGDQIKDGEMDRACNTAGRRRNIQTGLRWRKLKGNDDVEDLGVYGRLILKWVLR
jgi:hypothetical protein